MVLVGNSRYDMLEFVNVTARGEHPVFTSIAAFATGVGLIVMVIVVSSLQPKVFVTIRLT